ncbi:MAG: hypothetical protein K1X67_05145 [Fimbriimonadaceae bacterium]|nr:hypothetical protein [Fimbriimonadaceae bacterium]
MNKATIIENLKLAAAGATKELPNSEVNFRVFGGDDVRIAFGPPGSTPKPPPPVPEDQITKRTFVLTGESLRAYESAVDEVLSDSTIGPLVGRKPVDGALTEVVRNLISSTTSLDEPSLRDVLKGLRAMVTQLEVVVPIYGIDLAAVGEIRLGRVRIAPLTVATQSVYARVLSQVNQSAESPERHALVFHETATTIDSCFAGATALGFVPVVASEGRGHFIALSELSRVLSLLRYFCYWTEDRAHFPMFGTRQDVHSSASGTVCFAEGAFNFHVERFGLYNLQWTEQKAQWVKQACHWDELSNLLAIEIPSPLGGAILTAVSWVGRASTADTDAIALMSSVVAQEALLFKDGESNSADVFAKRLIHACGGSTKEERLNLYGHIKRIYDLRSRIVHQGLTYVDKADADLAKGLAAGLIHAATTRFVGGEDLGEMIADLEGSQLGGT